MQRFALTSVTNSMSMISFRRGLTLLMGWCLTATSLEAQTNHTVSGYVTDAATGETLIGATVWAEALSQGVASNVYGFYTLTLPAGTYAVSVSYLGYAPQRFSVDLSQVDVKLNLELQPGLALGEAVVAEEMNPQMVATPKKSQMTIRAMNRVFRTNMKAYLDRGRFHLQIS